MVSSEKPEEEGQDTHRSFTDAKTKVLNQHFLCSLLDKLKMHPIPRANNSDLLIKKIYFYFTSISLLPEGGHAWCHECPGTGVMSCGCWEL